MINAGVGDESLDMSDGYIDKIILQSTDRDLDSSGDLLDDSEDVFVEKEKKEGSM